MKTYLLFSMLCFVVLSCSTTKLENEIVKDFVNEKYKNEKSTKNIFLNNKSITKKRALAVYEEAYKKKDATFYLSNPLKEKNDWPINAENLIKLKTKYSKDTVAYYWKKTDFDSLNIPIMEYNIKFKETEIKEHLLNASKAYKITRPILFSNNKYALIYFISYDIIFGNSVGSCFILNKKDGKWVIINEFFDGVYN